MGYSLVLNFTGYNRQKNPVQTAVVETGISGNHVSGNFVMQGLDVQTYAVLYRHAYQKSPSYAN